jgi:hypothetical protein
MREMAVLVAVEVAVLAVAHKVLAVLMEEPMALVQSAAQAAQIPVVVEVEVDIAEDIRVEVTVDPVSLSFATQIRMMLPHPQQVHQQSQSLVVTEYINGPVQVQ